MKKAALTIGLWLSLTSGCLAQVSVQVVFEQEQFLRNESLPLKVRIVNSSGQTLHVGRETEWLSFEVRDGEGHDVRQVEKVPLADPFDLEASRVANLSIDLMPYFELDKVGNYSVIATLKVEQLQKIFGSTAKKFDIISGTKLWEREFGVPSAGVPEVRKYALQQASFLKQLRLYVRLTDPLENKVFRVIPLGSLVSFSKPETQLDKSSNLHVLFQNNARNFLYVVISPDGEVIIRQTHEYFNGSRPALRPDETHGVIVSGGRRRVVMSDLPPPPDEPPVPELAPEKPPAKEAPKDAKKSKK
jgi:hypothetical protein